MVSLIEADGRVTGTRVLGEGRVRGHLLVLEEEEVHPPPPSPLGHITGAGLALSSGQEATSPAQVSHTISPPH